MLSEARLPSRNTRVIGKIWNIASWVGIAAAVSVLLAAIALIAVPRALGWQGVVVLSGSMEPSLPVGSIVLIEPVSDPSALKVGDVITFASPVNPGQQITHRILAIVDGDDGLTFETKGDANVAADPDPVIVENLRGRARLQVPYVGRLVNELHDRSTYFLFIGIPALLLVLSELWNIAQELRRPKNQHGTDEGANS